MAVSGDDFSCHNWRGQRLSFLNLYRCTEQPTPHHHNKVSSRSKCQLCWGQETLFLAKHYSGSGNQSLKGSKEITLFPCKLTMPQNIKDICKTTKIVSVQQGEIHNILYSVNKLLAYKKQKNMTHKEKKK